MVEVITRLAEYRRFVVPNNHSLDFTQSWILFIECSYIGEFCRSIDKISEHGNSNCTHKKIALIFSRILSKIERTYSDLEVRQVQSEKDVFF